MTTEMIAMLFGQVMEWISALRLVKVLFPDVATVETIVAWLVVYNAVACLVCTSYAVCVINTLTSRSKFSIWLGFLGQGLGWACQFLAAIDYFHEAAGWPWFLLVGVVLANIGTAALFLANRRNCSCPGCPARHALMECER